MKELLALVGGLAWTVVYVEAIRVGLRDKTYAIPVGVLALNFAWEAIYAVVGFSGAADTTQVVINALWAVADVVIIYTYLRWGRAELPGFVTQPLFLVWSAVLFASAFVVQLLFIAQFGSQDGSHYSAFLQNLLMSGLFIALYVSRGGPQGQSLTIAIAKWIGTLSAAFLFGVLEHSPLVLGLGVLCSVFDLAYIALLIKNPAGGVRGGARPAAEGSAAKEGVAATG
ncbi:transmembrane-type terpene cyclase [Streptomyces sp. NPDC003952]